MKKTLLLLFVLVTTSYCQNYIIGIHRDGHLPNKNEKIDKIFEEASQLGAMMMRLNIWWSDVEKPDRIFDWDKLDRVIKNSSKYNIGILLTIRGFEKYNMFSSENERLSEYTNFLKDLFIRSHDQIKYYQIENELSDKNSWGGTYEDYANILGIAKSLQVKYAPNAKIVLAGIASSILEAAIGNVIRPRLLIDVQKTKDLIINSANDYDIIDLHLYFKSETIPLKVNWINKLLRTNNMVKDIWSSEIGGPDLRIYSKEEASDSTLMSGEIFKRFLEAFSSGIKRAFWHQLNIKSSHKSVFMMMPLMLDQKPRPQYYSYKILANILHQTNKIESLKYKRDGIFYLTQVDNKNYLIILENNVVVKDDLNNFLVKNNIPRVDSFNVLDDFKSVIVYVLK